MANTISPRVACRYLRDISDSRRQFHTKDGQVITNLVELACYMKSCSDEIFKHYVSKEHNHLANWVDHVILDMDLANQMHLVLQRNPMKNIVIKRVNFLVHNALRDVRRGEKARMVLQDAVLPEELFVTIDGLVVRNIWELHEFLKSAKGHVFSYHVSNLKNDFSDWIAEVLMDFELAEQVLTAETQDEMTSLVGQRVSQLEAFRVHQQKDRNLAYYAANIRE